MEEGVGVLGVIGSTSTLSRLITLNIIFIYSSFILYNDGWIITQLNSFQNLNSLIH